MGMVVCFPLPPEGLAEKERPARVLEPLRAQVMQLPEQRRTPARPVLQGRGEVPPRRSQPSAPGPMEAVLGVEPRAQARRSWEAGCSSSASLR